MTARPLARSTDPDTSHDAAKKIRKSGKLTMQQELTLAAVRRFPGMNTRELAEASGEGHHMLSRRLGQVRDFGLIVDCGRRGGGTLWWPEGHIVFHCDACGFDVQTGPEGVCAICGGKAEPMSMTKSTGRK